MLIPHEFITEKILKHYTTKKGKYSIKCILNKNNKIDIIEEVNGSLQATRSNKVYLQGIWLFDSLVQEAKILDNINYCEKLVDTLY